MVEQYEEGYRQYQSGYNTYLSYESQVKQYDESLKTIEDQINQLGGLEVVKIFQVNHLTINNVKFYYKAMML